VVLIGCLQDSTDVAIAEEARLGQTAAASSNPMVLYKMLLLL